MPETYSGENTTQGKQVSWYIGGTTASESKIVASGDVTAGYIALAKKAEWGSVILQVNGVFTGCTEHSDASGNVIADDSTGTMSIKIAGLSVGKVLTINYLDISTSTLKQVAMCGDVKSGIKADSKQEAVMGQSTKISTVGVIEQDISFDAFYYNEQLISSVLGDVVTDASGNKKFTTEFSAFKKIGAMIGKKYSSDKSTVLEKWFLGGVQIDKFDLEFSADGKFQDSVSGSVDFYRKFIPVGA
jgi:hypothetical protein